VRRRGKANPSSSSCSSGEAGGRPAAGTSCGSGGGTSSLPRPRCAPGWAAVAGGSRAPGRPRIADPVGDGWAHLPDGRSGFGYPRSPEDEGAAPCSSMRLLVRRPRPALLAGPSPSQPTVNGPFRLVPALKSSPPCRGLSRAYFCPGAVLTVCSTCVPDFLFSFFLSFF
jgi:hypothetical protein